MRSIRYCVIGLATLALSGALSPPGHAGGGTLHLRGAVAEPTCQLHLDARPGAPRVQRSRCAEETDTRAPSAHLAGQSTAYAVATWLRLDGTPIEGGERALADHLASQPAVYMIEYR